MNNNNFLFVIIIIIIFIFNFIFKIHVLCFDNNFNLKFKIFEIINNDSYELFDELINVTKEFIIDVYNNNLSKVCLDFIENNKESENIIQNIIRFSDFDIFADYNYEYECSLLKNFDYFLIKFQFENENNYNNNINNNEINEISEIVNFFNNYNIYFSSGICIPKNCKNYFSLNFNINNKKLQKYLDKNNIIKFHFISNEIFDFNTKNKKIFKIILIIIFIYIIIELIFSLIFYKMSRTYKEIEIEKIEENNNSKSSIFIDQNYSNTILNKNKKNKSFKFFESTSLITNFNLISKNNSNLYNNENLEIYFMIKTFVLFLCVFNQNFIILLNNPSKDIFDYNFFKQFFFVLIRYSTFSYNFFIALDGFIIIFKYMNYYKKHYYEKSEKLIKIYFNFLLFSFPKILMFFFNFFIIHFFLPNFIHFFKDFLSINQKNIIENIIEPKKCELNIIKYFFIPFYLQYSDYNSKNKNNLNKCYKQIYFYFNEFYIFILTLLIYTLCLKIKSRIFENLILIILILLIFLKYFSFKNFGYNLLKNDYFFIDINYLMGENLTLKFPHLFFNNYFIGSFFGLIYFYYIDGYNIKKNNNEDYFPFKISFEIMKFIIQIINKIKYILIIIIFLLQILLSLNFYFILNFNSNNNENIFISKINDFNKINYVYEKEIMLILFGFQICLILLCGRESVFKKISNSNFFNLINKIDFNFFCSMDIFIYIFLIIFKSQENLSFINLIFISFGQFIFFVVFSCLITVFFEVPLKQIINKIKI